MTDARSIVAACALALASAAVAQSGWHQVAPATQPPNRGGSLLAYDLARGVTVLYGGNLAMNDTWEWNGSAWTQRLPAYTPAQRCCSSFAYDLARSRIVMFGGMGSGGVDLADTWEYDGSRWIPYYPFTAPSPRRSAGMAFDLARGRMVLFGGGAGSTTLSVSSETWEWNGVDWHLLQPQHSPAARFACGMCTDMANGRILLHGGSSTWCCPATFRDTWAWNGTDWTQIATTVAPPAVMGFGFTYDWQRRAAVLFSGDPVLAETWLFADDNWLRDPSSPSLPHPNLPLAYDVQRSRTVMFGNYIPGPPETWEYVSPALASWRPFGTGCAGAAGEPHLNAVGGARPVLGTTFALEVAPTPASALTAIAIGFSFGSWNGATLPLSLGQLGMPGCTLFVSPDVPFFVSATPLGRATLAWPLPNVPAFAGAPFFGQAFVLDLTANALGAIVSNAGFGLVGVL